MLSKVYFTNLETSFNSNIFKKFEKLLNKLNLNTIIEGGDISAIKLHFGERGNTSFVPPQFLKIIVDKVNKLGGKPFLTDTNTLYVGSRGDAVSHIKVAVEHGFAFSVVNAPVIIADGLRGNSSQKVRIDQKWHSEVNIGSEIYNADALIAVTHFKCHELSGIGGVIKNVGMGCASVEGKLAQHSKVFPYVIEDKCTGCKRCVKWCKYEGAIIFLNEKAHITEKCVGCGACIMPCPEGVIKIKWDAESKVMQEKMVEHFYGAVKNKKGKCAYITFVTKVTPECDCYPMSGTPIIDDIGILASLDPVAIDQAAADLVNAEEGKNGTKLLSNLKKGEDKFRGIYPDIDWTIQLSYGEEVGIGKRGYELLVV